MKQLTSHIVFIIIILISVCSCFKIETYPPEPQIEFISFSLTDSTDVLDNPVLYGELHFSFIDGDGDLGFFQAADTSTEDISKTIFITPYKKTNGEFVEDTNIIPLNYRIPYFETAGNNKTLKGEIIVKDINHNPPYGDDTLKYKFYIKDRAGNVSNIEETQEFVLK
jgi:hypothetical protein